MLKLRLILLLLSGDETALLWASRYVDVKEELASKS